MEFAGGLRRFAEDVAPAEAGEIVGRKAEAKLVGGTMGAQQLELGLMQLGIQL